MDDALYVWIAKKCYRLYQQTPGMWRLFYFCDRVKLTIHVAHNLDYWRKKGVLEGEEEKEGTS